MKRLTLTGHTVCCPLYDCTARVTVRTASGACPSRRHRDVTGCSLLPSSSYAMPARTTYFPDLAPPVPYVAEVDRGPRPSTEIACSKRCLLVLNAAESGAAPSVRGISGVSDGLDLVRQTQSPAVTRLLWF